MGGGLYYRTTDHFVAFGSKAATTNVVTPAALTANFIDSQKIFKVAGFVKMNLDILYTEGASETANTIEVIIEDSTDKVNWFRIANESNSNGVSTLYARNFSFAGADGAASSISIGLDVFYRWVRISVRETGVAANAGSVFMDVTLAGA